MKTRKYLINYAKKRADRDDQIIDRAIITRKRPIKTDADIFEVELAIARDKKNREPVPHEIVIINWREIK